MWRIAPAIVVLLLGGCAIGPPTFTPGVEGRGADEVCTSTSLACERWTELARKCEKNTRRRAEGYMGEQVPYCTQAEEYRELRSGVKDSSAPGAYAF